MGTPYGSGKDFGSLLTVAALTRYGSDDVYNAGRVEMMQTSSYYAIPKIT